MNASVIRQMGELLRSGTVTSGEMTARAIQGAKGLNQTIEAFVLTDEDTAINAAERADHEMREGHDRGLLHGIPVAVKDIIDVEGWPTRCGSPAYPMAAVSRDATVVVKLRDAGAVIVGKTTAHELACGVYSPPASNPWDVGRVPGGSSGGSAAAVSAGIVPLALGSDTGGSIRIPAATCGVSGIKPTFGRVSRAGVEPLSWSLDHIGPIAATVEDCALALHVLAGRDSLDGSTSEASVADYTSWLDAGVSDLRIGVLQGEPFAPMQPEVADVFAAAVEQLGEMGAEPVEVAIAELEHTLATESAIVGAVAGHYHRRLLQQRPELIDPGIRDLLVSGLLLPASHYLNALQARRVIARAIRRAFVDQDLDVMVSPTLPATAVRQDQEEIEYADRSEPVTLSYVRTTAPFNLSGLPAVSVPCGFDGDRLPIGLQVVAPPFEEAIALGVAAAYESGTGWRQEQPPIHAGAIR